MVVCVFIIQLINRGSPSLYAHILSSMYSLFSRSIGAVLVYMPIYCRLCIHYSLINRDSPRLYAHIWSFVYSLYSRLIGTVLVYMPIYGRLCIHYSVDQ